MQLADGYYELRNNEALREFHVRRSVSGLAYFSAGNEYINVAGSQYGMPVMGAANTMSFSTDFVSTRSQTTHSSLS